MNIRHHAPARATLLWTALLGVTLVAPASLGAQDAAVESATRAGPASLSDDATVMAWDGTVIRRGSNGWTCLPDREDTPGTDPWCVNAPWLNLIEALVAEAEPTYDQVGIAYMLRGDTPVSNTDPYATEKTSDADWVAGLGAHLMILVPDRSSFANISTDPHNGGPWIMWPDTPYAHIMIPIDSYRGHADH